MAASWLARAGHDPDGRETGSPPYRVFIGEEANGSRERNQDLRCRKCGREFEIKARPFDRHLRVSHSEARTMDREQDPSGAQLIVSRGETVRARRNADLLKHIPSRPIVRTEFDAYIELAPRWAREHEMSMAEISCPGRR